MLRWLIPFLLISLLEFYSFQAVKTVVKSKWVLGIYLLISLAVVLYIVYFFLHPQPPFVKKIKQTSFLDNLIQYLLIIFSESLKSL